jgi:hypothetical protein
MTTSAASRNYTIVIASDVEQIAMKAMQHLHFTLHWSRQFFNLSTVDESLNTGEKDHRYQLHGHALWYSRIRDMENFSYYYPHATFTVTRTDDNKKETYKNGQLVEKS